MASPSQMGVSTDTEIIPSEITFCKALPSTLATTPLLSPILSCYLPPTPGNSSLYLLPIVILPKSWYNRFAPSHELAPNPEAHYAKTND